MTSNQDTLAMDSMKPKPRIHCDSLGQQYYIVAAPEALPFPKCAFCGLRTRPYECGHAVCGGDNIPEGKSVFYLRIDDNDIMTAWLKNHNVLDQGGSIDTSDDSDKDWPMPVITVLEWYAGLAMQGLLAAETTESHFNSPEHLVDTAFKYVQAMLAKTIEVRRLADATDFRIHDEVPAERVQALAETDLVDAEKQALAQEVLRLRAKLASSG